ncbi:microviridin/marinostatin family tricyclic proteinase inhibitor [Chitinophaga caseinilytica]|jgi:hypothetical protein|uniref:Microviridin/marinostatin family tricyclic proteinase inhibitor n=1 Tax=Chitinophaga caseinilytica TaxID=2267521 RepID=A0ABZ2Z093_9BACT
MKPNEKLMKPFFAQLLESQQQLNTSHQTTENSHWTSKLADVPDQTQKYPSDGDEEWWLL